MTAHNSFIEMFDRATEIFDVVESDHNGTGYFNGLVRRNLRRKVGTTMKAIDQHNRRVMAIVTPVGNAVVFERYTDGDKGVLVCNVPDEIKHFTGGTSLHELEVGILLGTPYGRPNIGTSLMKAMQRFLEIDWTADQI